MIRAILFDLGDTLIDFEPFDNHAMFRTAGELAHAELTRAGHALPPVKKYCAAHLWAIRRAYVWSILRRRDFSTADILARLARRFGLPHDDRAVRDMAWTWYAPVLRRSGIEPDLVTTLEKFRDAGVKMGIVSNTVISGQVLDRHMETFGLLEFFPVRIYSCNTGYRKPDPRIFRIALDAIGTDPRETLFVGDRVDKDIRGAKPFGMKTALKPRRDATSDDGGADYTIRAVSDLLPIVLAVDEGFPAAAASERVARVTPTDPAR